MMVRDVRETLVQILKEHYGLSLIHFSFIIDILSCRHCKSRWIHEIIGDISSLSARYLELNNSDKINRYSDLFLYAKGKICWYLKKIKTRRKRILTMNLLRDVRRIEIWMWTMCKEIRMMIKSVYITKAVQGEENNSNKTQYLLLTLWFMWMTLIKESLLDALVYIDCKEVWIDVQWERERKKERMV